MSQILIWLIPSSWIVGCTLAAASCSCRQSKQRGEECTRRALRNLNLPTDLQNSSLGATAVAERTSDAVTACGIRHLAALSMSKGVVHDASEENLFWPVVVVGILGPWHHVCPKMKVVAHNLNQFLTLRTKLNGKGHRNFIGIKQVGPQMKVDPIS